MHVRFGILHSLQSEGLQGLVKLVTHSSFLLRTPLQSPTVSQLSLSSSMHGTGGAAPAASPTAESQVRQAARLCLGGIVFCCADVACWGSCGAK